MSKNKMAHYQLTIIVLHIMMAQLLVKQLLCDR